MRAIIRGRLSSTSSTSLAMPPEPEKLNAQAPPHPFDPLSAAEIEYAITIIRKQHGQMRYNAVSLSEPKKAEMLAWLVAPNTTPRPRREAEVVVVGRGFLYDGIVDLVNGKISKWERLEGVQPIVSSLLQRTPKSG